MPTLHDCKFFSSESKNELIFPISTLISSDLNLLETHDVLLISLLRFLGREAWCVPTLLDCKTIIVVFNHLLGFTAVWQANMFDNGKSVNIMGISAFEPGTFSKCQLTILPCL